MTKQPTRRAKTWPVLMERIDGLFVPFVSFPSWKVIRCSVTKDGGYILRIEPTEPTRVEAERVEEPR